MLTPSGSIDSVAVVGASTNVDSPGHDYVHSLRVFGFEGPVYPVNPRAAEVDGRQGAGTVRDVRVRVLREDPRGA